MKQLIIIFLLLSTLSMSGQERPYRTFITQYVAQEMAQEFPNSIEEKSRIESIVHNYHVQGDLKQLVIPVIFNNVHASQEDRISEALIQNQLATLNAAFNPNTATSGWRHPAHRIENLARVIPDNIGIQFCLAKDQTGQTPITAINYIKTDSTEWSAEQILNSLGIKQDIPTDSIQQFRSISPEQYLNIWVMNLEDPIGGFATMPWTPKELDGIVIDYDIFGTKAGSASPYNGGTSLVHLVGSFIGLYELWDSSRECGDDRVADTPIHNAPNYGPLQAYKHVSICGDLPVEFSMNYMDATDDDYMYLFTTGQIIRMHALLSEQGPRYSLTQSATLCEEANLISEDIPALKRSTTEIAGDFRLYPNPTDGLINIAYEYTSEELFFQVFDSQGQLMKEERPIETSGIGNLEIDCRNWLPGIYFITATHKGKKASKSFSVIR